MKIAVFSTSKESNQYLRTGFTLSEERVGPLDVDFFTSESQFWKAVQKNRYEVIFICAPLGQRVSWGRFLSSLERLWLAVVKNHPCRIWQFKGKMIALEEQEIYYLFSVQKAVSVHARTESYRISSNMKQEEERLPSASFFRIHRNCLVNLMHVKRMEGNCLVLRNGVNLLVSSRRKKQVKERLMAFWEEKKQAGKRRKTGED